MQKEKINLTYSGVDLIHYITIGVAALIFLIALSVVIWNSTSFIIQLFALILSLFADVSIVFIALITTKQKQHELKSLIEISYVKD